MHRDRHVTLLCVQHRLCLDLHYNAVAAQKRAAVRTHEALGGLGEERAALVGLRLVVEEVFAHGNRNHRRDTRPPRALPAQTPQPSPSRSLADESLGQCLRADDAVLILLHLVKLFHGVMAASEDGELAAPDFGLVVEARHREQRE